MELPSMNSSLLWLLILLQIIHLPISFPLFEGNYTDRLSLLAFKAQLVDPLGILSSWNESLHFCQWSGVTCGRRHQRVVELELNSSQLVGSLSPHVGNLSFLRLLNLENNSFSHNIPEELGRLFRLQTLRLGNNTFGGEIPSNISLCSNLHFLHVGRNNLTGKLPSKLELLSKLQVLVFENNNLVGEIPPSFGNLSSIENMFGVSNNLQGGIPSSIGQLTKLKRLSFGLNNLSGTIPPSIYNLSSLTFLAAPVNQLHGILPPDLGLTLPNLEVLLFYTNQFSGPIPGTISNISNLSSLQLGYNSFTGKLPELGSLSNLRDLNIFANYLGNGEDDDLNFLFALANNTNFELLDGAVNNFGGVLPEIICNFSTKLVAFSLGGNQIRGSIPTEIGNLVSITTLSFQKNHLGGIIPSSIGRLQNLALLYLDGNKISGSIPLSIGNLTSLLEVSLGQNNLQGTIPSSLGNWSNILALTLSQNNLSGPIPKELLGLSSLSLYLVLSQNQLTGSLPFEVGKLVNLGYLEISRNRLSGEIPDSLGSCTNLERLFLEKNSLQGPIPESLSSLKGLRDLNLSYNNLTGPIPKFLGDLKLENLDLSFNDLEGEVPMKGIFANASGVSVSGNKQICGGIPRLNLSRCAFNESTKSKSSTKLILTITIPCGFIGLLLVTSSLLFYCLRKSKDQQASGLSWAVSFQRVSYQDLFQATSGFSSANLIGAGSFGSVYRGILPSDGMVVAVKVLNLLRKGASKSFMAECAALANIRHRNLVKVLTTCSSIDFQGNDFKALVYEFMVNGSLEEWLHPIYVSEEAHVPRNLNLIQRLNIAIDVACAIVYLHQYHCQMPIVHCDLKPSNVLLDGDMTAHVGDFGLARFLPQVSHQHLSSDQTSSVGLKGTIGYAAPEYGMGSEVSTYGDVYSYGILLLEMFTGKRPTDGVFKDGLNLHNYAKIESSGHVMEVVDPILLQEPEEERRAESSQRINHIASNKILECLISVIRVGLACSVELPRERMDISQAEAELRRIKGLLLGTKTRRQHEIIHQIDY